MTNKAKRTGSTTRPGPPRRSKYRDMLEQIARESTTPAALAKARRDGGHEWYELATFDSYKTAYNTGPWIKRHNADIADDYEIVAGKTGDGEGGAVWARWRGEHGKQGGRRG